MEYAGGLCCLLWQVSCDLDEASLLALRAAETVKEQRQEREVELRKRIMLEASLASSSSLSSPASAPASSHGTPSTPSRVPHHDPFTDYGNFEPQLEKVDEFTRVSVGGRDRYHGDDDDSNVVTAVVVMTILFNCSKQAMHVG